MSKDKFLEKIAFNAINYIKNEEEIRLKKTPWDFEIIDEKEEFIELKVFNGRANIYFLVFNQNKDNEDISKLNTSGIKNFRNLKGSVNLSFFKEYEKYKQIFYNFIEKYKTSGQIIFTGHGYGATISLIASAFYNMESIVFSPLPFIVQKSWMENYSINPIIYVDESDPFSGNDSKFGQIVWKNSNHYNVIKINSNKYSHDIKNFKNLF